MIQEVLTGLSLSPSNFQIVKSAKNDVGSYSKKHNLNLILWPYKVPPGKYDVGVVVSFGQLIPGQSIDACANGILNAHASLLPKLRGAAPIFRAILNDYNETGVTIMRIKADNFDVGDTVLQERVRIDEDTKSIDLHNKLARLSASLLMKCLHDLDHYLGNAVKQNEQEATKALRIKPEESRIRWPEMELKHVYKLYRAFDEFFAIYTTWIDKRELKLFKMVPYSRMVELQDEINGEIAKRTQPGTVWYLKRKKLFCVKCKDQWAGFGEVCLKGHPRTSAKQFNNGHLQKLMSRSEDLLVLGSD